MAEEKKPRLALKVDVDTYGGTRRGVPKVTEILKRHEAGATFFFSLGPDHTGLAARLCGSLLPVPDIGKRCASILRKVRDEGFEVGIHGWDHANWRNRAQGADAAWSEREMTLARDRFREIFAAEPEAHAAAAWRTNVHALRRTQRFGLRYASDTRGHSPFIPVVRGEIVDCPQVPTTLPTLDELIGPGGVTADTVAEKVLALTAQPRDHVYTLRAELEGGKLAPAFEQLLEGWKAQGYRLVALGGLVAEIPVATMPLFNLVDSPVPGRPGTLATQGAPFLAFQGESSP